MLESFGRQPYNRIEKNARMKEKSVQIIGMRKKKIEENM